MGAGGHRSRGWQEQGGLEGAVQKQGMCVAGTGWGEGCWSRGCQEWGVEGVGWEGRSRGGGAGGHWSHCVSQLAFSFSLVQTTSP